MPLGHLARRALDAGPQKRLFGYLAILNPSRDEPMLNPYLIENALLELHGRNPIDGS